jgi:hypothetical protein
VWGRRGGFAFQTEWSNRDGRAELELGSGTGADRAQGTIRPSG